jgi:predicted aldo/keto reductase-like oxidoreductase
MTKNGCGGNFMAELGFGFLRLPLCLDGSIDYPVLNEMVDAFIANGGRRFDTAYMYHDGESEVAVGKSVASRYPRDRFHLTSKLPGYNYTTREECYKAFAEQLEKCRVDYFDIYMLHWMTASRFAHAEKYDQFGFLQELKASGKAKKIGFSFHDTADLLDEILTKHPEVDCVLMQINYLDWESEGVQSRKCYEVVRKHDKEIIVMEPVKGGTLVHIPAEAAALIGSIAPGQTPASQAIRFVRSLEGITTVLSGMSSTEQMLDNLRPIVPMTLEEQNVMLRAADAIRATVSVGCTGCGYCTKHCPQGLPIPTIFKLYNEFTFYPRHKWKIDPAYAMLSAKASDCIGCGSCEANCPQKLAISQHMRTVAEVLEA